MEVMKGTYTELPRVLVVGYEVPVGEVSDGKGDKALPKSEMKFSKYKSVITMFVVNKNSPKSKMLKQWVWIRKG